MQEIWKDIPGYENKYQASNLGNIKSLKSGRRNNNTIILKGADNGHGYLILNLSNNGSHKQFKIHRLVAQTFIPNPENKKEVNHKNGIRYDNRLENLEWCTPSENLKHKYKFLGFKSHMIGKKGGLCHHSKKVNQYTKTREFIRTWDCMMDIQRELGINNGNIGLCCKGKRKTSGGFIWKFNK